MRSTPLLKSAAGDELAHFLPPVHTGDGLVPEMNLDVALAPGCCLACDSEINAFHSSGIDDSTGSSQKVSPMGL
jgi:hypothetical protein